MITDLLAMYESLSAPPHRFTDRTHPMWAFVIRKAASISARNSQGAAMDVETDALKEGTPVVTNKKVSPLYSTH